MFLQYVEVEVKPEKLDVFTALSRAFLGAIARQPGGVTFRIFRFVDNPLAFASVRLWRSKAEADAVWESPHMALMERMSGGMDLFSATRIGGMQQFELIDMAWGLKGPAAFPGEGRFVHWVSGRLLPENYPGWRTSSRNIIATVSRQPGTASFEHFRPVGEATGFVVIRTYLSQSDEPMVGLGASPEMQWVNEPTRRLEFYKGVPAPAVRKAYLHDMVWGAAGAACQEFMEGNRPYTPPV